MSEMIHMYLLCTLYYIYNQIVVTYNCIIHKYVYYILYIYTTYTVIKFK